ncbi:DUF3102 domain-containing protein [Dehalobacterium formicoaceticum]|uniref:DUF3102 domain-containing protein n=1 Tax=Dehalobacterium formicoaceticum TaxID=51515 RepID=UPI000B7DA61A|nr:DUF3102 domain-containing protein [Dehalobacterium formicoaceticum]
MEIKTTLNIYRNAEQIAAEINGIKKQTRAMLLYNSIEIGRRLWEAKSYVPHGEWGTWLQESVEYSPSTAHNLMRIFEEYGAEQLSLFDNNAKSQALGNLSYTQAVALLGIPQEEREEFIKDHDLDSMSTRELQKAIKERDEALKKLENAKKTAEEVCESNSKLMEEKENLETNARILEQIFSDVQKKSETLHDTLEKERNKSKEEILSVCDDYKNAGAAKTKIM